MKLEFYKHIEQKSELDAIVKLLKSNNIPYEVSSAASIIDASIVGTVNMPKFTLKLHPSDFQEANHIIKDSINVSEIDINDYQHLKLLDNDELFEILRKPEEWTVEAELAARKILEHRNVRVSQEELEQEREALRIKNRKGKSVPFGIQVAYFISIIMGFIFGIIFLIAGISMGYYYAFGKTVDENGNKQFIYDKKAREGGKLMLVFAGLCFLILCIFLFLQ